MAFFKIDILENTSEVELFIIGIDTHDSLNPLIPEQKLKAKLKLIHRYQSSTRFLRRLYKDKPC